VKIYHPDTFLTQAGLNMKGLKTAAKAEGRIVDVGALPLHEMRTKLPK